MKSENLLFLCTGNSCRSQMAEGWAKALAPKLAPDLHIVVQSAGLEAHGLNLNAIETMGRYGIDISGHTSDIISDDMVNETTTVVTVCSHADESCPVVSNIKRKVHIPFDDPAKAVGSDDEIRNCFESVCLQIRNEVEQLLLDLVNPEL